MGHALSDHRVYVVVGKRVDHVLAIALRTSPDGLCFKVRKLMRNGALRRADHLGQIGHGQRSRRHKGVEDLDAGGVGEHLEEVGQIVEQLFIGHHVGGRFIELASQPQLQESAFDS